MVEKGVKPKLVVVSPRRLTATQDWLADDRYRDDGSVFEEYADHPVVLTLDGEAYILDGHHRCSGALTANRKIKVYVFGGLVGVAEGAIDNLEARRIEDLNLLMDEILVRFRTEKLPAHYRDALKQRLDQLKAERNSYYHART
jgi:hypothetical protein